MLKFNLWSRTTLAVLSRVYCFWSLLFKSCPYDSKIVLNYSLKNFQGFTLFSYQGSLLLSLATTSISYHSSSRLSTTFSKFFNFFHLHIFLCFCEKTTCFYGGTLFYHSCPSLSRTIPDKKNIF